MVKASSIYGYIKNLEQSTTEQYQRGFGEILRYLLMQFSQKTECGIDISALTIEFATLKEYFDEMIRREKRDVYPYLCNLMEMYEQQNYLNNHLHHYKHSFVYLILQKETLCGEQIKKICAIIESAGPGLLSGKEKVHSRFQQLSQSFLSNVNTHKAVIFPEILKLEQKLNH